MIVRFLVILGIFCAVGLGTGSLSIAAEKSDGPADEPAAETAEQQQEPTKGPLRRRLEERLHGATPEEAARLDIERQRLSEAAARFGTDPTAMVGFYQLAYGRNTFTNNLSIDSAVATVRLPVTPNFLFQVNMPYVWTDLNQPRGSTLNGTSDLNIRTGGRIYANEDVALFIGTDAFFPTASEQRLGTGKYTLGPGAVLAAPMPRARSIFFLQVFDYNSIGGDPSRPNIHFAQVNSFINTIWSNHWWTIAGVNYDVNWNHEQRTSMELSGQVGYRFDHHWAVFAGPSAGVMGRDTILGQDWAVQAGVRWIFKTPLIPERLFEKLPM
jgi:hypothetical protein